jgi:hypothetical protein
MSAETSKNVFYKNNNAEHFIKSSKPENKAKRIQFYQEVSHLQAKNALALCKARVGSRSLIKAFHHDLVGEKGNEEVGW